MSCTFLLNRVLEPEHFTLIVTDDFSHEFVLIASVRIRERGTGKQSVLQKSLCVLGRPVEVPEEEVFPSDHPLSGRALLYFYLLQFLEQGAVPMVSLNDLAVSEIIPEYRARGDLYRNRNEPDMIIRASEFQISERVCRSLLPDEARVGPPVGHRRFEVPKRWIGPKIPRHQYSQHRRL